MSADDDMLAELDIRVSDARLAWRNRVFELANENTQSVGEEPERALQRINSIKDYRDLGEEVSFRISQFLFHLSTNRVNTGEDMERRLRAHNAQLEQICLDPNYYLRTGHKLDRIREMIFTEATIEHAAMVVDRHNRPVLNETVLAGLMVRVAGKSNINRCIRVYEQTGLVETRRGPSNSKLIVDYEKLVATYRLYLSELAASLRSV